MIERRKMLAGLGSLGSSIAIAGCSSNSQSEDSNEQQATSSDTSTNQTDSDSDSVENSSEQQSNDTSSDENTESEDTDQEGNTDSSENEGETRAEIKIDWKQIQGLLSQSNRFFSNGSSILQLNDSQSTVTHVGARLEYPEYNAAFSQSATRETSEDEGIITIEVPPTDTASLYVAAVNVDEASCLLLGALEDISIEEGANTWETSDVDWVEASWSVIEEQRDDYESGTFQVDNSERRFSLKYKVTYPFHSDKNLQYEELLIGLNGSGSSGENTGEYYTFSVSAENPSVSENSETEHTFYPYLDSQMFNLPAERYRIDPIGEFTVSWE